MADLAYVFHWPPSEMDAMPVDELRAWHDRAVERLKAAQPETRPHGQ